MVSVRADGYKLGGAHFTVDQNGNLADGLNIVDGKVVVELIPEPLPLSKIVVRAFEDTQPVNGEDDIPAENGLAGFTVIVEDTAGEVTTDWTGSPICGDGHCVTGDDGTVTIHNLPRGLYEVLVIPPDGTDWLQTTTIEGTKVIDAWVPEGSDGLSHDEFGAPMVWVGFVKPKAWTHNTDSYYHSGTGRIEGTVKTAIEWLPPIMPTPPGETVEHAIIALTDIGQNDQQVYTAKTNNGHFVIENVPDGLYQMAIWDEHLEWIISFETVQILNGNAVDMGDVTIPRWFGLMSGTVFLDEDKNLRQGANEPGIPGVELLMRYRDGTVRYATATDGAGQYEFPEIFQLGKFYVTEVGFGHLGATGAHLHNRYPANPFGPDVSSEAEFDGALTVANLNWAGKREVLDWGKYNYAEGEHGGISGIVHYATTRNEFEARIQATEDYETRYSRR